MTDVDLHDWIGREETRVDILDVARAQALSAALSEDRRLSPGDPIPPLAHWLYFWDVAPPSRTGTDGHPKRGGFLPPIALPRRMWAGGRLEFFHPLQLGERVTRTSAIRKVTRKDGRSGALIFVTVEHRIDNARGTAIVEEQDLVYRDAPSPGAVAASGPPAGHGAEFARVLTADPVLLFRYSALTMNSHRIHYDRRYATEQEGYEDLVIQGPLQATLLADFAVGSTGKTLRHFEFRGAAPAFIGDLQMAARHDDHRLVLWTVQHGGVRMTATASF